MDLLQRDGKYPVPPQAGPILGVDFAGTVVDSACGFTKGEAVFGLAYGGAYAEYIASSAKMLIRKPDELSFEEAAGIPEVWFTATQALFLVGGFKQGMSALFHAGASGYYYLHFLFLELLKPDRVGQALIQLAKSHGASKVFATAGTDEKCKLVESCGAVRGINYRKEDFAKVIEKETDGKGIHRSSQSHQTLTTQGVDFIVDFVIGGDYWNKNIQSLARVRTSLLLTTCPIEN